MFTLSQYIPLHHPDGAAVSITEVNELPGEARRSFLEGLITLPKQLRRVEGTDQGPVLRLGSTQTFISPGSETCLCRAASARGGVTWQKSGSRIVSAGW